MRLYFKKHPLYLLEKLNQLQEVHISAIVYSEFCSGVSLSPKHLQRARQNQLKEFITLTILHSWDEKAAVFYAKIRADLKAKGSPIGNTDMLIAAHAFWSQIMCSNLKELPI